MQTMLRISPVRPAGFDAKPTLDSDRSVRGPVSIRVLGTFHVQHNGRPILAAAWQSKKARDLLKVLIARRGRAMHREKIADTLWPDEDPALIGSRVSVALSRVRAILDPERRFPQDHYVAAEDDAISLSVNHMDIDLERFLRLAGRGLVLLQAGRTREAVPILTAAEASYAGDFLEENCYEDWTLSVREQARTSHIAVARSLAEAASMVGDRDGAIRGYLRVLERDPYDEEAHLGLVSTATAGRHHGEARRYYRAYVARMEEIGVAADPFPLPDIRVRLRVDESPRTTWQPTFEAGAGESV